MDAADDEKEVHLSTDTKLATPMQDPDYPNKVVIREQGSMMLLFVLLILKIQ